MTIDDAKIELASYKVAERIIAENEKKLMDKKISANKLTPNLSPMPKSIPTIQDMVAEKLATCIDEEPITRNHINKLKTENLEILNKIYLLDIKYQEILLNFYIYGNTAEKTACAIGYSESHINRLKMEAIKEYSKIK